MGEIQTKKWGRGTERKNTVKIQSLYNLFSINMNKQLKALESWVVYLIDINEANHY